MKSADDAILRTEQAAYLERMLAPRDELLLEMESHARASRQPISDPEVGTLLYLLARARRPRLVVELGTNIGYGAIVLARGAGPDAKVVTAEIDPALVAEARGFVKKAGLESRVEVRETRATDLLESVVGPIDMAYIDCVKEEYPRYLELLVPKLGERGMIVADNVLWSGHVARADVPAKERARTDALRRFNAALVKDPRLKALILPVGDGVALAMKE